MTIDRGQRATEVAVDAQAGDAIKVVPAAPPVSANEGIEHFIGFAAGAETYAKALAQGRAETENDPTGEEHTVVHLDENLAESYGPIGQTGGGFEFTGADLCVAWIAPVDGEYVVTFQASPPGGPTTIDVTITTERFEDFDPEHPIESSQEYNPANGPHPQFPDCFLMA